MILIRKYWAWFAVIGGVFLWTLAIMFLAVWKYNHFFYNAIDLAYFNQVFWNTIHGHLFGLTIHPHLSLGDHAEFFILVLAPLYALFQHPLTLVALQTLAIGSAAIPLFLLFRRSYGEWVGVGIALAYLFNPFIQQAALFEFHILPFFWPLFLWAFYLNENSGLHKCHPRAGGDLPCRQAGPVPLVSHLSETKGIGSRPALREGRGGMTVAILIFLILLVREDVALLVAAWGVMNLLAKRGQASLSGVRPRFRARGWLLLLVGIVMFVIDQVVIGHFQPTGSYKFLTYYGYLGASWGEVLRNMVFHPGLWLGQFFRLDRWELIVGLVGPFLLLPLLSWRFWVLAAVPLLEFGLQKIDSHIVLQTHYQFLFWPAIIVGLWHVLKKFPRRQPLSVVFLFLTIGLSAVYSPVTDFLNLRYESHRDEYVLKQVLEQIPKDAGVVASYSLLPQVSSRRTVLATHYAHLNRQQYSKLPYEIPAAAEYIVFDLNDSWDYLYQYGRGGWSQGALTQALRDWRERLRTQGFGLAYAADNIQLWKRNVIPSQTEGSPVQFLKQKPIPSAWWHEASRDFGSLRLVGYEIAPTSWEGRGVVAVRLLWQATGEVPANTFTRFITRDIKNDQVLADQILPLSQNLIGSNEWNTSMYIATSFWLEEPFRTPGPPLAERQLVLQVGTREVNLNLNFLGTGVISERARQTWGEQVLGALPFVGK